MAQQRRRQQNTRIKPLNTVCPYCKENNLPNYKDWEALEKYVSDRKKIMSRLRSGICSKHQKVLAREVKRARHLALLPFSVRING